MTYDLAACMSLGDDWDRGDLAMRTPITESVSVSREHFLCHLAGAISREIDLEPIASRHGVELGKPAASQARVPYSALTAIRLEICRQLDDENEGFLERSAPWGSTVFMCRAIVSSISLREALNRYQRFSAILTDEVRISIAESDGEVKISFEFENRKAIDNRAEVENRMYFLYAFLMWLTDRRFSPRRIGFQFAEPSFVDDYRHIVPTQYFFDQGVNCIILDAALMRLRVRQAPRTLNQFLANHHAFLINESLAIGSVTDRVTRLVEASISGNTNLERVASALLIPPTTLRRRLKAEGASFQFIKDEVRKRQAMHYLVDMGLTVSETSELTGFSDPAVFSRAFKMWTGVRPSSAHRIHSGGSIQPPS